MHVTLTVFDLDGTLIDSLEDLADSMNTVLASKVYPTHPLEPDRRRVGDGVATRARRARPCWPGGRLRFSIAHLSV